MEKRMRDEGKGVKEREKETVLKQRNFNYE